MEKEVLKEDIERFHSIMEYIMPTGDVLEDGGDPDADPNAQGGAPAVPAGPSQGEAMPPAGPEMGGGMPGGDMGGAMPPAGPEGDPNAAAPAGPEGDPNAAAPAGPEGFDPQVGAGDPNAAPEAGAEQPGPDDNVLDVDDLTSAQEEANAAIQGLDSKFEKLVGTLDKFISAIDKNDSEIQNLKAEIEKRNPTPLEKLDLRSVKDSFPYNVKPTDYWKDKESSSNYRVGGDEDDMPEQYELHQSDVDNTSDWKAISDSLDDDGFIADLNKIIGF